jgi:hypothetical protein
VNLAPVIQRLTDECPFLKLVGGAAQFERALQGLTAIPAAFVLPARDRGTDSPFANQIVEQEVSSEFSIVLAARNLADDEGAAAVDELERIRAPVRDALLNWQPDDDYAGLEFRSGELLAFANGVLWWGDVYATAYLIRSV